MSTEFHVEWEDICVYRMKWAIDFNHKTHDLNTGKSNAQIYYNNSLFFCRGSEEIEEKLGYTIFWVETSKRDNLASDL